MGTIGYSVFEDDAGADWVAGFLQNPFENRVASILISVKNSAYLGDRQAIAALCCAEIVASALGNSIPTIPAALLKWAGSKTSSLTPLASDARCAMEVVKKSSELSEMWGEDLQWFAYMKGLTQRLTKS